jgi:hypothetical protein
MKKMHRFLLAILLFCVSLSVSAGGTVSPRPETREFVKDSELFFSGKFGELTKRAEKYRNELTTLSDGQDALEQLYLAVSGCDCSEAVPPQMWALRKKLIGEWIAKYPKSSAAKISLARYEIEYAWDGRGGGYASQVSDEGWKLFNTRLAHAHKYLDSLDPYTKKDPGWYSAMLAIAKGEGWPFDKTEALFQEAVARYPYYLPTYYKRAKFFEVKWGGSKQQMDAFIERAVELTKSKMGDSLYARLRIMEQQDYMDLMPASGQWPRIKNGLERITRDYPDPWIVNAYALFACLAQDYPAFMDVSRRMNGNIVVEEWPDNGKFYSRCQDLARDGIKAGLLTGKSSTRDLEPKPATDGTWKPPANPDGRLIYASIAEDIKDGYNKDALAKLVWFQANAKGVDTGAWFEHETDALKTWALLAKSYPPAKDKLKAARDAEVAKVKAADPLSYEVFRNVTLINFAIGEQKNTLDLWTWAEANNAPLAEGTFGLVLPSIIFLKEYKRADRYLDATAFLQAATTNYKRQSAYAAQVSTLSVRDQAQKKADRTFSDYVTTLVALLAVNGRKREAEQVRDAAIKQLTSPEFEASLVGAMAGNVPPPVF